MKMSLVWHKECLNNVRATLASMRAEANRRNEAVERQAIALAFYESQIARAEAMGKDGFDDAKFGVKK